MSELARPAFAPMVWPDHFTVPSGQYASGHDCTGTPVPSLDVRAKEVPALPLAARPGHAESRAGRGRRNALQPVQADAAASRGVSVSLLRRRRGTGVQRPSQRRARGHDRRGRDE
jgi:hypothetical protein